MEKLKLFLQRFRRIKLNENSISKLRITYQVVWNLLLLFIIAGAVSLAFGAGIGAGYFASLVKDEPLRSYDEMKDDIYNYEESSEIYFNDNVYLGKLRANIEREEVSSKDVSPQLKNAIIATEDEFFYEHDGVVPKAILRALFQEFTNSSVRSGGSTLTQQLIKNQLLTNEVSFDRKAKEILLALRLENFFEKEEILEAYMNVSTLGRNSSGRNIAGVQSAAQGIFGVNAKDLSIPQAAFIAGLPQSPFGYTPFTNNGTVKENLEPGVGRMKSVLSNMYDEGFITKKEYDEALTFDLRKSLTTKKPSSTEQYPFLTYEIEDRAREILIRQLAEKDGHKPDELKQNEDLYREYYIQADANLRHKGYRIHTTINKKMYDKMQAVAKEYQYYGSEKPETKIDPDTGEEVQVMEPVEVGGVLIENKTGKILSFVGGRNHDRKQVNHATDSLRSNGSTMKPLAVYAPAMEMGVVQPGSVVADTPMTGSWNPKNYGGRYHGLTSIRTALKHSYNIPAARTYLKIQANNPVNYLDKMGFTSLAQSDYTISSLALGAMKRGVTVEENVNAFSTFANGGKFVDAYMIEKIENSDGEVVYEHKSSSTDVFSAQTSYLSIDMMRDVISSGTAASLKGYLAFSADWAGKTGTGQDYKDAWFVASNPNVSFGTWIGYDTPKPIEQSYKGLSYSKRNILLWAKLMNVAHETNPDLIAPKERFKMPGGIVERSYCSLSGDLPSELCQKAGLVSSDLFNEKYVPKKTDDSLTSGKYVVVKNSAYHVPSSAPSEFVQEGVMLKKEVLWNLGVSSVSELENLLPNQTSWGKLVVTEGKEISDNGSAPTVVNGVSISGNNLSWSASGDNDVIGYRVYAAANHSSSFKKIASVPASKSLTVSVGSSSAAYYVVAVDVAGQESAKSAIVKNGDYSEKKPDEKKNVPSDKEKKPDEKKTEEDKPKPQDKPADDKKQNEQ
ncbi:transglycosylase domain-containing protein [Metabacillus arenae]|uniref:Penicillin-binding protein n=1 Tax=Metabacillus arenae TaxID=2771434 RepID=A0A926NGL1_9BACI|nr:transglycosylase domain-containing protein [Metabacillus arenae]MBD1380143.1 penicillin-binding protein [Metabacillus arenae]